MRSNCFLVFCGLFFHLGALWGLPRQNEESYGQHANYAPVYRQEAPQNVVLTQTAVYSPRYSQGNTRNVNVGSFEEDGECEADCSCEESFIEARQRECENQHHGLTQQPEPCQRPQQETCHWPSEKHQPRQENQHSPPKPCPRFQPDPCHQLSDRPLPQPSQNSGHLPCLTSDEDELVRFTNIERIEELVATYIAEYLIKQLTDNGAGVFLKPDTDFLNPEWMYLNCQEKLCQQSEQNFCRKSSEKQPANEIFEPVPACRNNRENSQILGAPIKNSEVLPSIDSEPFLVNENCQCFDVCHNR